MRAVNQNYLTILRIELDDLSTDIEHLIQECSEGLEHGFISQNVFMQNLATFKNELLGVHSFQKILDTLQPEEYSDLDSFIEDCSDCLDMEGRLAVISFHSLEDRIVKQTFKKLASSCSCPKGLPQCICDKKAELRILTSKPVTADEDEICTNPRSRSAKLRAAEKVN